MCISLVSGARGCPFEMQMGESFGGALFSPIMTRGSAPEDALKRSEALLAEAQRPQSNRQFFTGVWETDEIIFSETAVSHLRVRPRCARDF